MSPSGSIQAWESGIAHNGNRSVSMTGPTPNLMGVKWETIGLIPVVPGEDYALSMWGRSEGPYDNGTGRCAVRMWYYDAAGIYLNKGWGPLGSPELSTSWLLLSGSTTVPSDAAKVRLDVVYWSKTSSDQNKVYFDDIELRAVEMVIIDIKPGTFPNAINLGANGVLPVAILTTPGFDASTVDPATVQLAGAGTHLKGNSGNVGTLQDVDGDGDLDLVVQVNIDELELVEGTTEADLTGATYDSTPIKGNDSIRVVPQH